MINNKLSIADQKQRIGDWKMNTIIEKGKNHALVSIVERKFKFTLLKKVMFKIITCLNKSTIDALELRKDKVLAITRDNGTEFAYHKKISEPLEPDFYCAHPYLLWERSDNKNTNNLARHYIKKDNGISYIVDVFLNLMANKLRTRPRKSLTYPNPKEILMSIN